MINKRSLPVAALAFGFLISALLFCALTLAGTPPRRANPATPASSPIESDGSLDPTFDAGNFTNGTVLASLLQPDGKLLIGGSFSKVHGVTRLGIARLNVDGTFDESFDAGLGDGIYSLRVDGFALQSDGRILVFGELPLRRLNADGSLDTSFQPANVFYLDGTTNFQGSVKDVLVQPDGKIVVAGHFFNIQTAPGQSVPRSCIARFNTDGSLDSTFSPGTFIGSVGYDNYGFPNLFAAHLVRQTAGANSGKLVVEGDFNNVADHRASAGLVRLNADGSYDSSFTPSSQLVNTAEYLSTHGLKLLTDDRLILFGYTVYQDGTDLRPIVRLSSEGVVDPGFNTAAFTDYDARGSISAVAEQADGKLLVGGYFHSLGGATANNLARLETDGSRDTGFAPTAAGPSAYHIDTVLVRDSDSSIFAGGSFSTYAGVFRNNMAWVNPDGSVADTFAGLPGVADDYPNIYALAVQPDGKVLAGGGFTSLSGVSHYNLVRLNDDGTMDHSFQADLAEGSVRAIILQPDGKIVIGGYFTAVNGVTRGRIARLEPDGSLDPTFDPGSGADDAVFALSLDADGSIFAGGQFYLFAGEGRAPIVKLRPNGVLDATFVPDDDVIFGTVYAIAPPDGRGGVVIGGGLFYNPNGHINQLARLDTTTGAPDTSFSHDPGFSSVRALLRDPEGRYYAAGTGNPVTRFASDGTVDSSYVGAFSGYTLALQDGKIYVGAEFLSGALHRLTETGANDPTFEVGAGFLVDPPYSFGATFPGNIAALTLQPDGRLLVGGFFNQYNGAMRVDLARLTESGRPPTPTPTPPQRRLLFQPLPRRQRLPRLPLQPLPLLRRPPQL